jgi:Spy/CpxP family protein refolding chaperone
MKHLKYMFGALLLAAVVGSLVIGFGQQGKGDSRGPRPDGEMGRGGPPPHGGPGGFHPRMLEQLNLSEAQATEIRALHEQARTASEQYFEQMKSVHEQLKALSQAATFNEEQARALLAEKAKVSTELELIRLRTDSAIYNKLTAEQKASLTQFEQEHPGFHRKGGRGEGRGQR